MIDNFTFTAMAGFVAGRFASWAAGVPVGDAVVVAGGATISGGTFTGGADKGLPGVAGGRALVHNGSGPGRASVISDDTFTGTAGPTFVLTGTAVITLAVAVRSITGGTIVGQATLYLPGTAMR